MFKFKERKGQVETMPLMSMNRVGSMLIRTLKISLIQVILKH